MCLIAYRSKPGTHISNKIIDYNMRLNPDGFGITWQDPDDGTLNTVKFAPEEGSAFVDLLKKVDRTRSVYVAHWRRATHGEISRDMSHPFTYRDKTGKPVIAFHNGIINIATRGNESDTAAFVNRILRRMPFGWWDDPFWKDMVEDAIGWSRMLFWTPKGIVRLNERDWVEKHGILYSTSPDGSYSYTGSSTGKSYTNGGAWNGGWDTPPTKRESAFGDVDDDYLLGADIRLANEVLGSERIEDHESSYYNENGHIVRTVDRWEPVDRDTSVDASGTGYCTTCGVSGDYIIVDGHFYAEIDHITPLLTPSVGRTLHGGWD